MSLSILQRRFRSQVIFAAAACFLVLGLMSASNKWLFAASVLYVANLDDPAFEVANESVVERLTQLGHEVTTFDDDDAVDSDPTSADLVVISSTTLSTNVSFHFSYEPVPVIQWEQALWDEMLVSDAGRILAGQDAIEVVDVSHPLAALMGLTSEGEQIVRESPTLSEGFHLGNYSNLAPGAVVIAEEAGGGSPAIAVVDAGGELNDGSEAEATRVMLFYGDESLDGVNELGMQIFDAAVMYSLGETIAVPGDFNGDGLLNATDIDDLTNQSAGGTNPSAYDLNGDALVNAIDINVWAKQLFGTWIGDADLNTQFNSSDLVAVLASGTYEADIAAFWSTGDFNGDGRTASSDLVAALADGGYELGLPPAAVAEPTTCNALLLGLVLLTPFHPCRGRKRRAVYRPPGFCPLSHSSPPTP
jgi:hypothetical protein